MNRRAEIVSNLIILFWIAAIFATLFLLGCNGGGDEIAGIQNPTNSAGNYIFEKEIISFGLASPTASGVFQKGETTVRVPVSYGTDLSALIASFTVSSGATVTNPRVNGTNRKWTMVASPNCNLESNKTSMFFFPGR